MISTLTNQQMKKSKPSSENIICHKCRDMMFVIVDDVASPCECRQVRLCEDILRKSNVSKVFREKTFDSYDYSRSVECMKAFKMAKDYVEVFQGNKDSSVMFLGQVGFGKTHLSLAIGNSLIDDGVGVLYMSYREVIMEFKQNVMDERVYSDLMSRYKRAKVLLIDDLFKGSVTKSDVNIMFEIVNFRYLNKLPVIVSSELLVSDLIGVDEAIGSRLVEMCSEFVFEAMGKGLNYRLYGG